MTSLSCGASGDVGLLLIRRLPKLGLETVLPCPSRMSTCSQDCRSFETCTVLHVPTLFIIIFGRYLPDWPLHASDSQNLVHFREVSRFCTYSSDTCSKSSNIYICRDTQHSLWWRHSLDELRVFGGVEGEAADEEHECGSEEEENCVGLFLFRQHQLAQHSTHRHWQACRTCHEKRSKREWRH